MQGTGSYVLQWQNQDDQAEFLPSISSHKAQLMYFYETLPSAHYRYLHMHYTFFHSYIYLYIYWSLFLLEVQWWVCNLL